MKQKIKKGLQINLITINSGEITAYDTDGELIKLTRTRRDLFRNYHDYDFLNKIWKEFGNENILSIDFNIQLNGEVVYHVL